jgi:hypothetical protein
MLGLSYVRQKRIIMAPWNILLSVVHAFRNWQYSRWLTTFLLLELVANYIGIVFTVGSAFTGPSPLSTFYSVLEDPFAFIGHMLSPLSLLMLILFAIIYYVFAKYIGWLLKLPLTPLIKTPQQQQLLKDAYVPWFMLSMPLCNLMLFSLAVKEKIEWNAVPVIIIACFAPFVITFFTWFMVGGLIKLGRKWLTKKAPLSYAMTTPTPSTFLDRCYLFFGYLALALILFGLIERFIVKS